MEEDEADNVPNCGTDESCEPARLLDALPTGDRSTRLVRRASCTERLARPAKVAPSGESQYPSENGIYALTRMGSTVGRERIGEGENKDGCALVRRDCVQERGGEANLDDSTCLELQELVPRVNKYGVKVAIQQYRRRNPFDEVDIKKETDLLFEGKVL